jgi:hypothetical protein
MLVVFWSVQRLIASEVQLAAGGRISCLLMLEHRTWLSNSQMLRCEGVVDPCD